MNARLRKLAGTFAIVIWLLAYVAVAAVLGDRVADEHWAIQLLFYPLAGVGWITPLRPLIRWMHALDPPPESPNV